MISINLMSSSIIRTRYSVIDRTSFSSLGIYTVFQSDFLVVMSGSQHNASGNTSGVGDATIHMFQQNTIEDNLSNDSTVAFRSNLDQLTGAAVLMSGEFLNRMKLLNASDTPSIDDLHSYFVQLMSLATGSSLAFLEHLRHLPSADIDASHQALHDHLQQLLNAGTKSTIVFLSTVHWLLRVTRVDNALLHRIDILARSAFEDFDQKVRRVAYAASRIPVLCSTRCSLATLGSL